LGWMISASNIIRCKDGVLTFFVLQNITVLLVDHHATETIVRPETQTKNQLTLNFVIKKSQGCTNNERQVAIEITYCTVAPMILR
jgi:hypothetical protein